MKFQHMLTALMSLALGAQAYWMADVKHQGLAPYGGNNYQVFRNVKDFGAKGDGITDDTAAIRAAMNTPNNRCLQGCASTTQTPAVVYFPPGTYMISSSIVTPYYTKMIGDPTNRPVLKATANFAGFGLIDGNPYYTEKPNWVPVNVFFREVRNFVIDTTNIPPSTAATGMHWPTSQATSLYNLSFIMPATADVVHVGLFIEEGSGGFMADLTFQGGESCASMGNQQYTMRNFQFNNCKIAVNQLWNWGWTYIGLKINNCGIGIKMDNSDVGSVTILDSTITNTPAFIQSSYTQNGTPDTQGSIIMENIVFNNVGTGISGPSGTILAGGTTTIAGWGQGHQVLGTAGATELQGSFTPNSRPSVLMNGNVYYQKSKPQYESLSASDFLSARSLGARGDGVTDDTAAIQAVITQAAASNKVVYLDYGLYVVRSTINVPAGTRIVGETYPVILGSGSFFQNQASPQPVFKIGSQSGVSGRVEFSDFIVSTKGPAAGAILVEYNLAAPTGNPSGFWDFHTRIGGFAGSEFQIAQCAKVVGSANINPNCIAAYMAVHATKQSSGLYMENTWIWTADHDIEDASNAQITIFAGRGLFIESTNGAFWLVGGAVEHHHLYNYQFAGTKNIFASMLQTETPYYQPTPNAIQPFTVNSSLRDPDFTTSCQGVSGNCAASWGLRIIDSSNINIYGAGLYSFFNNYNTACNLFANGANCQARMVSIEGTISSVNIFDLSTIGTTSMINRNSQSLTSQMNNVNTYASNVIMYRSG